MDRITHTGQRAVWWGSLSACGLYGGHPSVSDGGHRSVCGPRLQTLGPPSSSRRRRSAAPDEHHPPAGGHKPASKTFLKMQTNMIADTRGTPTPEARTTFFVTNRRTCKRRPVKETNPHSPGGRGSVAGLGYTKKNLK